MRSIALAVVLLLALAACGTDTAEPDDADDPAQSQAEGEASDPPTSPTRSPSKKEAPPAVVEELEFTAETVAGDGFDGTSLAGQDAVVWFWAPWCTECRREAPYVAQSQAENPDVNFLGVAGLGETDDMLAFVDDYGVGAFEHLNDVDGSLWQRFGVVAQPAYAFVDESGSVEVFRGELGEDGIAERVATLTGN